MKGETKAKLNYPVVMVYEKFPKINLYSFDINVQPDREASLKVNRESFRVNLPDITPNMLTLTEKIALDC